MKISIMLCLLYLSSALVGQNFVSATKIKNYNKAYFTTEFGLSADFDVDLYKVVYTTKDQKGKETKASGLLCVPIDANKVFPLVVYNHGTVGSRKEVPSTISYESNIPSIFASLGFITLAPDYIGLGDDDGIHPYVHADTESSAARDMLLAIVSYTQTVNKDIKTNKHLFLTGYSQGGHASAATHRDLEKNNQGFTLKAASHMSGPYSISEGMKNLLLSEQEYRQVSYMANVALSYESVYGIFPNSDITKFFKPEFIVPINKYAKEEIDLWQLNDTLTTLLKLNGGKVQPKRLLLPNILDSMINKENYIVNKALRANDVIDWKPTVPTRLLYCTNDDQVAFQNALIAADRMKTLGAKEVTALDVSPTSNHNECVRPALLSTIFFFLNYRDITSAAPIITEGEVHLYPTLFQDMLNVSDEVTSISLYDIMGRTHPLFFIQGDSEISVSHLPKGFYICKLGLKNNHYTVLKIQKI
jgi:hypothetical protein